MFVLYICLLYIYHMSMIYQTVCMLPKMDRSQICQCFIKTLCMLPKMDRLQMICTVVFLSFSALCKHGK